MHHYHLAHPCIVIHLHLSLVFRNTVKPETPEHGTTEDETPTEHWRNIQPNTGRIIGIPHNSGTLEEQRNDVTKQHQEITPIQNDDILSR